MRWQRREARRAEARREARRARRRSLAQAWRARVAPLVRALAWAWAPLGRLLAKLPSVRELPPWTAVLPVLVVVGGLIYVNQHLGRVRQSAGERADALLPDPVKLEENIEVRFEEVAMTGRERGFKRWDMFGPKVRLSNDGKFTYFDEKPHGSFYHLKDWKAKADQPATRTRSLVWAGDSARYDAFEEVLSIFGHAHLVTDEEDTIDTAEMTYRQRTKDIEMPKPVAIAMKDGTRVTSESMTANAEAEVFEFKGKVRMVAPMKGGGM